MSTGRTIRSSWPRAGAFLVVVGALGGCDSSLDVPDDLSPDLPLDVGPDFALSSHDLAAGCRSSPDTCPPGSVCHELPGGAVCEATCNADRDCERLAGGGACCDGACFDLATDARNCGACGVRCNPGPNVRATSCVARRCVSECKAGFGDCDGRPANGCESVLSTDADNCGSCGARCDGLPHVKSPSCAAGACLFSCLAPYADCDAIAANGCESNLTVDLANCGRCGFVCGGANNTPSCSQGMCTQICDRGWQDCNSKTADGCEIDVTVDANNCGMCARVCAPGQRCIAGVCQ